MSAFMSVPMWAMSATVAVAVLLVAVHLRGRWLAATGFKHLADYPPTWLSAVTGGCLVMLATQNAAVRRSLHLAEDETVLLGAVASVIASAVGALVLGSFVVGHVGRFLRPAQVRGPGPQPVVRPAAPPRDQVFEWIKDDAPITSLAQDLFDHARVAHRVAARLLRSDVPSQAIVGPLGSGKSTIRTLVSTTLQARPVSSPRTILVPCELWSYETTRAAVAGIIGTLVSALAREVDVLALRGVPAAYAEAMTAAGGGWAAVAKLQGKPEQPYETLKRIEAVALAIDCRLVLWVEDLERFAGIAPATADRDVGSHATESMEDAERLNQVRAVLYALDQLHSVRVVTATTSLHIRFDIEKIARYVEVIPPLDQAAVATLLGAFRRACLSSHDVIDPADPETRRVLDRMGTEPADPIQRMLLGPGVHSLSDALPVLCATPRVLKHGLRMVRETWDSLPGEIDFDDLLAMSLLRVGLPEVFDLVQQHLPALRGALGVRADKSDPLAAWEAALARRALPDSVRDAVGEVIGAVFKVADRDAKPQGFKWSQHTDYWHRFMAVPELQPHERAQPILQAIVGGSDEHLIPLVEDGARSDGVEAFSKLIPAEQLLRLLPAIVERRINELPASWPDGDPPGLIPVWRMCLHRQKLDQLDHRAMMDQVLHALDLSASRNVALALEVEHYFVTPGSSTPILIEVSGAQNVEKAMSHLRSALGAAASRNPGLFADAVRGANPHTLRTLAWGRPRLNEDQITGAPLPGWSDLVPMILRDARIRPAEMLPQIAATVVRETAKPTRHQMTYEFSFDPDLAVRLYGSVGPLAEVFGSGADAGVGLDDNVRLVAAALRTASPVS